MSVPTVCVFRTRPKGDFLVEPFRLRQGSTKEARGTARILIPKVEYCARIAAVVLRALELYWEPVGDDDFDRTPDPPLQAWGAMITDEGDQLELSTMKRYAGGHMGTGDRFRVTRTRVTTELPSRLLEAMGERERDVARFMARYGASK